MPTPAIEKTTVKEKLQVMEELWRDLCRNQNQIPVPQLSERFPFAVYYNVSKEEIKIYAIVDCRREPA